ncbi:DUF6011 domain-containing protein [Bacillus sp. FJAT-45350]|uniref:DUF6011 domain-containing protein n=1 Tax=Bacillus sp. FJAT-45350 TaxID=2011014 RepID=UPI000BB72ADE|nr:DUF6011 domain-containing protein [Bacillus sp. FJAT-45350]
MSTEKSEVVRCSRCGRQLRDKESISRGYGQICWAKEQEEPSLIYLLQNGPVLTEFEQYKDLYRKQVEKRWEKVVS